MAETTPLLQQYRRIKAEYPDTILFFRMGDFYEMFFEDAEIASKALQITLTSRHGSATTPSVPLCGVPYHAVDTYLARMIRQGFRVAICEQVEDPRAAKGIVKREVVRVVTPGTVLDTTILDAKENNFIAAVFSPAMLGEKTTKDQLVGVALLDLSTGEFHLGELSGAARFQKLLDELQRFEPKEVVVPESHVYAPQTEEQRVLADYKPACVTTYPDRAFQLRAAREALLEHFQVHSLAGFGVQEASSGLSAAGALLQYIQETQKSALPHIRRISLLRHDEFMLIDFATQRNLELYRTIHDHSRAGSLLGLLDKSMTSMGARMLQKWLRYPLVRIADIQARLDALDALKNDVMLRGDLRELLKGVHDLERLITRLTLSAANARDLVALKLSCQRVPEFRRLLSGIVAPLIAEQAANCDELQDIAQLIERAIVDEPPVSLRDGNLIKPGYNAELDELRVISKEGKHWIAGLERKEKERSGIASLKVKYNKVFGYFIEITKPNLRLVPADYIIKQTLVNATRFITPELKEFEAKVLGAEDRMVELEYALFQELRQTVSREVERVLRTAETIAVLDALAALAEIAERNLYVKPEVNDGERIEIQEGRHPVIEQMKLDEPFIPNDTRLDCGENRLLIITGPNMAGKCLAGDALIFTGKGLRPLVELRPDESKNGEFAPIDEEVRGLRGAAQATHFYTGGRQKTVILTTRLGYRLEGTPEHKVWARSADGSEGWKPLGAMQTGDIAAIERRVNLWGQETAIDGAAASALNGVKNLKTYRLPEKWDEDLAYLVGLLIGDGTVTYSRAFEFTTADAFLAEEFRRIARKLFGYEVCRKASGVQYAVSSKQIRVFLERLDLGYCQADAKYVPAPILQAPRNIVVAFLQGVFDTDGYADKRYGNIQFSTASARLARQIHLLLLNFGIIASLTVKQTARKPSHQINIYGADALRFHREIGFRLPRKRERQALASKLRMPNVGGIPHLAGLLKQIQARIVATPNKVVSLKQNKCINSIFYTYLPAGRNISYAKLAELIEYCHQNRVECAELEELQAQHYFYDPVIALETGEAEVYDLSVPGDHAYIANGFVSHNSTYIRQVALITLMAQIGSFVPAKQAQIGVVDRIFTRIGASDNLSRGESTFMVEMNETANILNNATCKSLIILDEIGRGTSTFDGMSIAWAVAEYIEHQEKLGARALFATHYHELTELATLLTGVKNYNVAVKEWNDQVIFLRKIIEGGADQSYGIQVARLAGLPADVIRRAKEILADLEQDRHGEAEHHFIKPAAPRASRKKSAVSLDQLALFGERPHPVVTTLKNLDVNSLTPLDALNLLEQLKKEC